MIKVNLLNTVTGVQVPQVSTVTRAAAGDAGGGGGGYDATNIGSFTSAGTVVRDSKEVVVKVFLMFLPIVALYVWEQYNLNEKQASLGSVSEQLNRETAELEAMKPQVEAVQRFQEEKKKVEAQMDAIRVLSKERLRNVKAMDALHTIIPEKAWLTRLLIQDKKVELTGLAVEDIYVSNLMQGLEDSAFFTNVSLDSTQERQTPEGVLKEFKILSLMENL